MSPQNDHHTGFCPRKSPNHHAALDAAVMVFVPGVSGAARVSASVKWRMSFLLTSESGEQTGWTHFAWPMVRKLAQDFGWQPSGTQPPEGWGAELEAIGEW